jgi:hypothetical protein
MDGGLQDATKPAECPEVVESGPFAFRSQDGDSRDCVTLQPFPRTIKFQECMLKGSDLPHRLSIVIVRSERFPA